MSRLSLWGEKLWMYHRVGLTFSKLCRLYFMFKKKYLSWINIMSHVAPAAPWLSYAYRFLPFFLLGAYRTDRRGELWWVSQATFSKVNTSSSYLLSWKQSNPQDTVVTLSVLLSAWLMLWLQESPLKSQAPQSWCSVELEPSGNKGLGEHKLPFSRAS